VLHKQLDKFHHHVRHWAATFSFGEITEQEDSPPWCKTVSHFVLHSKPKSTLLNSLSNQTGNVGDTLCRKAYPGRVVVLDDALEIKEVSKKTDILNNYFKLFRNITKELLKKVDCLWMTHRNLLGRTGYKATRIRGRLEDKIAQCVLESSLIVAETYVQFESSSGLKQSLVRQ